MLPMVTVKDVPGQLMVEKLSEVLKQYEELKPPEWAKFIKTNPANERPPDEPVEVWWYKRVASVLRRVYLLGPIGLSRLRKYYGGTKRRRHGMRKRHKVKGSGKLLRYILQQLEKAGLIQWVDSPRKGRAITKKGKELLDKVAEEVAKEYYKGEPKISLEVKL
ncbi:NEQ187 [Nanoarchaeum equitans Kin4-M]|uniref:Small ribosomal subunit protein eS19 n=1 Tax=Nanoarchaeum equitans (strain Kin4-M) TaxID=228908 RepID=Q74NC9_NANEQ|nr:NEQ187 [Nanoarchaeum equitans Kin4-M]